MESKMFSNQKVIIKAAIIAALSAALLIPAFLIEALVKERKERQEQVSAEVGKKWGLPQTLSGFVLAIPYTTESKTADGKSVSLKNYYVLQPRRHNLSANMQVQLRKRSIYQVPLYDVASDVNDVFSSNWQQAPNLPAGLKPAEALLCLPVTDKNGIKKEIEATVNGTAVTLNTELALPGFAAPLLAGSTDLSVTDANNITVSSSYSVKGSGSLYFYPNAKQNHIEMRSPWQHPSFQGYEVPDSNRVNKSGFIATWDAPQQTDAVTLPYTAARGREVTGNVFGVAVIQPGDSYSKTLRTVKYAILVIVLSFSVFFITELVKRIPVHALQYILVGAALVIFYTLLLAISEYTSYNPAYAIAALATVLLIGFYTAGIYRSISLGLAFTLFMGVLYTFIFVMIQLQDNALLFGSIGLFAVVAAGMYVTRKMNARLAEMPSNTQ